LCGACVGKSIAVSLEIIKNAAKNSAGHHQPTTPKDFEVLASLSSSMKSASNEMMNETKEPIETNASSADNDSSNSAVSSEIEDTEES
jgi:hypothetical protein